MDERGQMSKPREFWIDMVLNFDRPYTKTAYVYEQDAEDKGLEIVHVREVTPEPTEAEIRAMYEARTANLPHGVMLKRKNEYVEGFQDALAWMKGERKL